MGGDDVIAATLDRWRARHHRGIEAANDDDKDWCDICESVTVWNGETCACCGYVWGTYTETETCRARRRS